MSLWAMNIINNKLGTFWCVETAHGQSHETAYYRPEVDSHYSLVETSKGQLGIQSLYWALSDDGGQQSPHEYH